MVLGRKGVKTNIFLYLYMGGPSLATIIMYFLVLLYAQKKQLSLIDNRTKVIKM